MLVLTRRLDETIVIGDDIEVQVLGVSGNRVKLGVSAPREMSVHRGEVLERMECFRAPVAPSQSLRAIRAASLAGV